MTGCGAAISPPSDQTIAFGVRNANDKSRQSQMPRFGADGMLTPAQINDVAEYVLSLTQHATDAGAAKRGEAVFVEQVRRLPWRKGEGNVEQGGPRLNDNIWLYGGDKPTVVQSIFNARSGNMPAWSERLDDATVKMLTVYVHTLGGGK